MTEDHSTICARIQGLLTKKGFSASAIDFREFPDELIVVVNVPQEDHSAVLQITTEIDELIPGNGFSVVRAAQASSPDTLTSVKSVADERVTRLIELLNERSRTSEQQPSLSYIRDAAENLRVALTKRHHLILGRRGVGKTALLLEAKAQIETSGGLVVWINMQSLRELGALKAFLNIVQRVCELPKMIHKHRSEPPRSVALAAELDERVGNLLAQRLLKRRDCAQVVADAQRMINIFCAERAADLYIFVDDVHYVEMQSQPVFLDLLHGITRDTSAWLNIAGIKNQCRVFTDNPPVGLQIGHDAALISLDVTQEEPKKALAFLTSVLRAYLATAGIANRSGVLTNSALAIPAVAK